MPAWFRYLTKSSTYAIDLAHHIARPLFSARTTNPISSDVVPSAGGPTRTSLLTYSRQPDWSCHGASRHNACDYGQLSFFLFFFPYKLLWPASAHDAYSWHV